MQQRFIQIALPFFITITLFSLWAAFALLIVNKYFYKELPGYTIGRICIWEFVALVVSYLIAKFIINKWGRAQFMEVDNDLKLVMNYKYGVYFTIYFIIGLIVGIWQFWIFSMKF